MAEERTGDREREVSEGGAERSRAAGGKGQSRELACERLEASAGRGGPPGVVGGACRPPSPTSSSLFLMQRMAQKRQPEEEKKKGGAAYDGCYNLGEKRQRVPDLGSVILEVMKVNAIKKLLKEIEPQLRRVVKEEVELALGRHLATMKRQCGKQVYPTSSRSFQLQFITKLSLPIFTGTKIEGEDCSGISIALVDSVTGKVVASGPESLMKVEIVVLEGDFEVDEENWTFEEFKSNIVKEREGKRPLLSGDVFLDLISGTGVLGELAFTDNSSWTRSRKFRLGARVEDGYFNGMRVKEAKTEPFMVKDHRGELYKKHYPPVLTDEVWRLEKIGKDGAFHKRLSSEGINTVKDFLTLLHIGTQRLRNILGTGMSAKMWEVTVEHARTCILGNNTSMYYPGTQHQTGVAFNIVGEVTGIVSDGQYLPVSELSDAQKVDAHKLVKMAFEHWDDVTPCDTGTATVSSHASSVSYPTSAQPLAENFYNEFSGSCRNDGFSFSHPNVSSPDMISSILPVGGRRCLDTSVLQAMDSMESRYDPSFLSHDIYTESRDLCTFPSSLMFDGETSSQTLFGEDHLRYFDSDMPPLPNTLRADSPADLESAVTGFLAAAAAARGKVNKRWRMLISVLRWRFSIKRIVNLRRKRLENDRYSARDGKK